jgi:hypothetical protein
LRGLVDHTLDPDCLGARTPADEDEIAHDSAMHQTSTPWTDLVGKLTAADDQPLGVCQ